jgi:hypothetical protein
VITIDRSASESPARVEVPGAGQVTLVGLEQLRSARASLSDRSAEELARSRAASEQAEDGLADLGALLVPRRAWWSPPEELVPILEEADQLVALIEELDLRIEQATRPPRSGLLARVMGRDPERVRSNAVRRLREILVTVGRWAIGTGLPVVGVPDARPLLASAHRLKALADELHGAASATAAQLDGISQELWSREQATRLMGFDALYVSADIQLHGLPSVETVVPLQRGEIAHLSVPTTLARAPGSLRRRGQPPPTAHTGLRFWLGTFNGSPMPALGPGSVGTMAITNRFLHFSASDQSFATPLDNLVDVDTYTDGLSVVALGRETVDFYRLQSPRQVAFYLNWALEAASS